MTRGTRWHRALRSGHSPSLRSPSTLDISDGPVLRLRQDAVRSPHLRLYIHICIPRASVVRAFPRLGSPICYKTTPRERNRSPNLLSFPFYVFSLAVEDRRGICVSSPDLELHMEESQRFTVGYALAPKKKQSFIQPSLVNLARERGIDLVPIDTDRPLSAQGPFDCVLQKFYGEEWKAQLKNYAIKNPLVPIIDQPDAIERLHNRISMLQVVSELDIPQGKETFGIPSQIVVYDSMALSDFGAVGALRFPVIAKPLVADGSAKSHKMSLVYNRDGLLKLKPPLVLQEFVNHGGVIFKVYVVGDHVKCVKRKSLPDVYLEKLDCTEGSLSFSQVSNITHDRFHEEYYEGIQLEAEMPPASLLTDIARGLREVMRLHLFNFDIIRDSKSGNHYFVIDINYFPGYAKMPAYEKVLTDFLWYILNKKMAEGDVDSGVNLKGEETKVLISTHCDGTKDEV